MCFQKRALRLLTISPYRTASNPLFFRLKILKIAYVTLIICKLL